MSDRIHFTFTDEATGHTAEAWVNRDEYMLITGGSGFVVSILDDCEAGERTLTIKNENGTLPTGMHIQGIERMCNPE